MSWSSVQLAHGQSRMSYLLARVPRKRWERFEQGLSSLERAVMHYQWNLWARLEQTPPPEFANGVKATWLILGGRGMGKTRPGSQQVIEWAKELGPKYGRGHIALIAKDPGDYRDVMIEGQESGILACSPPWFRPIWEPSLRQLTWPNGVIAHCYSSETPDDLRGPQHHKAWGDEPAKWKHAQDTWDQLQFGLRLGDTPQSILTGTPRPIPMLLDIIKDPDTVITRGKTSENEANLSARFLRTIYRKYQDTRLGRQELNAEILADTPGALWTLANIEECRVRSAPCPMITVVVAIDPGVTDPQNIEDVEDVAETGIVVVGRGEDQHGYAMHDLSGSFSPDTWGQRAVSHYTSLEADRIIGEANNGGDLVEFVIKTAAEKLDVPYTFKKVHASRGKRTRAEPISALYEQKRMHHIGAFPELEDQMTTWVPGMKSPDRMDALVWGATEVMLSGQGEIALS